MRNALLLIAALPALATAQVTGGSAPPPPAAVDARVERLREAALADDVAYDIMEGLTTEVGPRLAGTEAEARARSWAVAKLRSLGFQRVRVETFRMPTWVRGVETAEVTSPFPQKLHVTALGQSASTGPNGLTAEVVGFDSVDALRRAPVGSLRGRIAFVTHRMTRTQDGSQYGFAGPARWNAPQLALERGAAAIVIRSIGTDDHRNPHTGGTNWARPGQGAAGNAVASTDDPSTRPAIPAGALSNPDADQLERMLARAPRGRPVTMKLVLTPRWIGEQESGNVVAEVPGSDPDAGVVLVGGHLDSWDLATGAFDNAAGVAITAAAAKRVMDAGRPRRTIRVVWFGAEEVGVFGGSEYHRRHAGDVGRERIVFVSESDFGADRVWRMDSGLGPENVALADRVAAAVAPLGIARGQAPGSAGADLGAWARDGVAVVDLQQDGTRYFDLHHTPDDTLDKVDREQLRQNVAAWTAMLSVVANAPEAIGRNAERSADRGR